MMMATVDLADKLMSSKDGVKPKLYYLTIYFLKAIPPFAIK